VCAGAVPAGDFEVQVAIKTLIDSVMETMHFLGASVAEIQTAMQEFFPVRPQDWPMMEEVKEELPAPVPKPIIVEDPPVAKRFVALSVADEDRYRQQWFTEQEARQIWKPYTPHVDVSGRCSCGHGYAEHLPCCVHLVEGCSCEEFHPVNAVAEGA